MAPANGPEAVEKMDWGGVLLLVFIVFNGAVAALLANRLEEARKLIEELNMLRDAKKVIMELRSRIALLEQTVAKSERQRR